MEKKKRIFAVIAAAFLLVACVVLPSYIRKRASAAEDVVTAYEEQNVWADLQGSVIAGEAFTVTDYPHNDSIDPSVITLVEFGFSWSAEKQADYGLYLYVYNPQDVAYDETRNRVQLQAGDLSTANYPLELLNYSNAPGYEGRFYKFKISLTAAQRRAILGSVSENARRYTVVSFELSRKNTVKSYTCAQTYTYSGYSLGYGSELAEESTLTCAVDGFEKYVELDVHQTVYRKEGDFYEGKQMQLNSCYFRVPEKYFTDYGELTRMLVEWEEYITQPLLVGPSAYTLFQDLHGGKLSEFSVNMDYLLLSLKSEDSGLLGSVFGTAPTYTNCGFSKRMYRFIDGIMDYGYTIPESASLDEPFYVNETFAGVFSGGGMSTIDDLYVSETELTEELLANSEYLGGPYYGNGYSQALFTDYVEDGHTRGYNRKFINADDIVRVWYNDLTQDFWQTLFGGYNVDTPYDLYKAIVTSADEDFNVEGTAAQVSERLLIGESDVPDFLREYAKAQLNGERLVLLRYAPSTYYSFPSVLAVTDRAENSDEVLVKEAVKKLMDKNYNSLVAQETVYLDFDIISMWFMAEDGAETEIAVVMSPQDVFGPLTPPLGTDYDNEGWKALWAAIAAVLGLVLVIVVLALLAYFVPGFLNFLIWCVEFPFKVIGKLSGEISQAVKRRREERERERRENGGSPKSGDKADGGRDRKNKKSDGGRDRKGD